MPRSTYGDPMSLPWWKTAVAYQIYPRSFCDTTGNGIGDLEGIRRHLDHICDLGADALWLSPFFPSPMADYGYDVSDYCEVDPLFGDLAGFDRLLAEAHDRNLRVIIDWVPNHTSIEHPWFTESRASQDSPKRDWYVWRDPAPGGGPPNNWIESLTFGQAWTLDPTTGQYYLHCFLPEQPDLNWSNPEVAEAMAGTLRFWLDRGVDGFRMDVVHLIGKDPALPDEPADLVGLPHTVLNVRPETHDHLRRLRILIDSYPDDRMAIGEIYLLDTALVASHYGHGDELHLCFNFPPLYTKWNATDWRASIADTVRELDAIDAWPTWVLSNHDNKRHRSRYGDREDRSRAAAVMLCTLRGTPFLYAGEELGLSDAVVSAGQRHDPAGRDGCRAPIPWDGSGTHGWATSEPWLPWPPDATVRHAESQRSDPTSIFHLYRDLLALRRATPELQHGDFELIDGPDPARVLAYRRGSFTILVSMTDERITTALAGGLVLSSAGRRNWDGTLDGNEAVILTSV